MSIELGTTDINKIYLGTNEIKKIILGTTTVYDKTGPPPVSQIGDSIVYALTASTETLSLTESTIALDTESQIDTATFSAASGVVTISTTGTYLLINHLAVDRDTAGGYRTSGESFLHINNTIVSGAYTDGYIRRTSSADAFTDCAFGIYDLTANDTVELRKLRINGAGSDARVVGNATTYTPAKTALSMVRLDETAATCILEGAAGDTSSLISTDTFADQTWTTQTRVDTGFTHTGGSSDIQIDAVGRYLVTYSNSWSRAVDSNVRTGVYERLDLAGADVPGTYANNYIRGSQNGEQILRGNNSTCTIIETTAINQILKLKSAKEASTVTCDRIPLKSRICIYKLDSSKAFNIGSSSTQNVALAAEFTAAYDSSSFLDAGFSLASNQVTVTDASKFLLLNTMETDGGAARAEPFQRIRINGVNNLLGTGEGYCRNSGSMVKTSPNVGIIANVGASEAVEVRTNTQSSRTSATRVTLSGAFCGLDLSSL